MRNRNVVFGVCFAHLVIALFCAPANAGVEKVVELYNNKEYAEAFAYFQDLAEVGNGKAQFNIGVMYYHGEGVPRDDVQAYAWIRTAADTTKNEKYASTAEQILATLPEDKQQAARDLAAELHARLGEEALQKTLIPKPLSDEDCTQEIAPLKRENPNYPNNALSEGKMGAVVTEFTITPQGYVRDLIVTTTADQSFAKETARILPKWRYTPRVVKDKAVPTYGVRVQMIFQIDDSGTATNMRELKKALASTKEKAEQGDIVEQYQYAMMLENFNRFKTFLKGMNLEYQEANKWLLSSAVSGFSVAQFQLGRNMVSGRGCAVDEAGGMKWITAAAAGGHPSAQHYLARNLFQEADEQKYRAAIKWLKGAVAAYDYFPAKVMLAWEYAASTLQEVRDGKAALELINGKSGVFFDHVRVLETEAAAHAEIGDFSRAITTQKDALEKANSYHWEIPEMQARLASYQAKQPWRGEYYQSVEWIQPLESD
ncbi:MAG TPA: energy transducer TonB [Gammaproteobacteria bacterium]|nr:energy transducer TonB [Gammaproteobacteria bacterium]